MMGTASRVVFLGPDREPSLLFEECRIPEIEKGQILAKILCATICGSDLHTIDGKRKELVPSVLGHEAVAEIVECQREGCGLQLGDRITFTVVDSCSKCDHCINSLPQKCHSATKYGHQQLQGNGPTSLSGCYASHIVLHEGTAVYKVPSSVTNRIAAPANCAVATMGAGLLGIIGCVLLRERGYSRLYISDPSRDRLVLASQFGAVPVNSVLPNAVQGLAEDSVDVVLEVCGDPQAVEQGIRFLKPGGTYILAGMVHRDTRLSISGEQIIRKCLTLKGIHNYGPSHLQEAIAFLAETVNKYPYGTLFSPDYSLRDLKEAVEVARSKRYPRVVVVP